MAWREEGGVELLAVTRSAGGLGFPNFGQSSETSNARFKPESQLEPQPRRHSEADDAHRYNYRRRYRIAVSAGECWKRWLRRELIPLVLPLANRHPPSPQLAAASLLRLLPISVS